MQHEGKYSISVLGDSISTYIGYNPPGYPVYYRDDVLYDNEMTSVNDTWWKQVIDALGGELNVNNSFSGSFVAGASKSSACSDERCAGLSLFEAPDLILIYMGTNDRGYGWELGMDAPNDRRGFLGAYRSMLQKIKRNYPAARIVCATLPLWKTPEGREGASENFKTIASRYDEAIRTAAKDESCLLADLAAFEERYEAGMGCHPTKKGHEQLASLWLRALKGML